jgi:hypothetical protein
MPFKTYPTDVLEQAADILAGCGQIDPDRKIGTFDQQEFADAIAHTRALQTQINALDKQTGDLRSQRDGELNALWDGVKRTRSSVKGEYGDDSSQYKLVGGTRLSDRKRNGRKKPE